MPLKREEVVKILQKLKPFLGESIHKLGRAWAADPNTRKEIERILLSLSNRYLIDQDYQEKTLLTPPSKQEAHGEYLLGKVLYEKPLHYFGLRENELPEHISIFGRSGSGKTNIGYILIWNLLTKGKPFLIFDWKRNYRHFLNRPIGEEILTFTVGRDLSPFYFNPLIPPKNLTSGRSFYLRELISLLCDSYFPNLQLLSVQGVEYLLLKGLEELRYENRAIRFRNLFDWMQAYQATGRERDWKSSALNVLYKLSTGPISSVLNASRQVPIQPLLKNPVIFELDSLGSPKDKSFFIQSFLLYLYHHRLAQGKSDFKHLILIEEAHHVLSRGKQEETITDLIIRQIREFGESIVIVDQHPSLTSVPGLGNTFCTIALNLKSSKDIEAIAPALLLKDQQISDLGELPVGTGIVKLQDRYPDPFLVKFPLFPIGGEEITDEMVNKHMRAHSVMSSIQETRHQLQEAVRHAKALRKVVIKNLKDSIKGKISKQGRRFLIDVAKHPLSTVTERYQRIGLNAYQGTKLKNKLIEESLIQPKEVNTITGKIVFLRLTETGKKLLRNLGYQGEVKGPGDSYEHEYWKKKVKEHYQEKGYRVEEEKPINGGKVDLVASREGEKIAIEIETGKSDAIGNIQKDREGGFAQIVSVTLTEEVKQEILEMLEENWRYLEGFMVVTVKELFRNR